MTELMICLAALSSPDYRTREAASAHTSRLVTSGEVDRLTEVFLDQLPPEAAERLLVAQRSYFVYRFGDRPWPTVHALCPDRVEGSAPWDALFVTEYGDCWQCYSEVARVVEHPNGLTQTLYRRKEGVLALEKRVVEIEIEKLLRGGKTRPEVEAIIKNALSLPQRPTWVTK